MAVPSIPALFVIMRVSPTFAPPAVTNDGAIANAVVMTIGLASPGVTSVWPPMMVMPSRCAVSAILEVSSFTVPSSTLSGRRITDCMKLALFPLVATSLALTTTAWRPAFLAMPVTGSEETMRNPLRSFTTPKSRPTPGRTTSSSEGAPVMSRMYLVSNAGGSFPSESFKCVRPSGTRHLLRVRGGRGVNLETCSLLRDDPLDASDEGNRDEEANDSLRDVEGDLTRSRDEP